MHGLCDGPLLFQMAFLHSLITNMGFHKSLHDENFLMRYDARRELDCIIVVHVDDLLIIATYAMIQWCEERIQKRFGKLKRNQLLFAWCGMVHEQLSPGHFFIHQTPYLKRINPVQLVQKVKDTAHLGDADYFAFRSLLMSMLWLCKTRQDLLQEICALQTAMVFTSWTTCKSMRSWYDLARDECFSVTQEDLLTEQEVIDNWTEVEAADAREIASFVKDAVFAVDLAKNSINTVDGTWVRKWVSRTPVVIKSRCCGRGFLDIQKQHVDKHSSTTSVLSHRLGLTLAAQYYWVVEGFDVSTAFL